MTSLRICTCIAIAAALFFVGSAQAVPLNKSFVSENYLSTTLPGTTLDLRPELAGTVIADQTQAFSSTLVSGWVQSRVLRTTAGTLDFYWRIFATSGTYGVNAIRFTDLGYDQITDADWRADSLGSVGPTSARVFSRRLGPSGAITFGFDDPVLVGSESDPNAGSRFFFLHTTATAYQETGRFDLLSHNNLLITPMLPTFAPVPVVPEPGALVLTGLGLAAFGATRTRRGVATR